MTGDAISEPLLQHYEQHLGSLDSGWVEPTEFGNIGVARFVDSPEAGFTSLATFGMSESVLAQSSKKPIRQEIVTCVTEDAPHARVGEVLLSVGLRALKSSTALRARETIVLPATIQERCNVHAVYITAPPFFESAFDVLRDTSPATVIAFLLMISAAEEQFITTHGWEAFEDRMGALPLDELLRDNRGFPG